MARAADTFPLHRLVWHNRHQALDSALRSGTHDVELTDPRGRTPLELAVSLGHLESVRVLLRHNANVGRENANGWTVLQEAVSTGDPEIVQLVLQYRDYQRATRRLAGIPELLSKLRRASDFYVEMKWEFTSWVPLVSKVCPSDVYRVWKRGESLRVDTTLLGFEHMTWQRGRRSYIFKGEEEGAVVMEVDHDKQVVYTETLALALHEPDLLLAAMQPSEEHVAGRLTSPIVSTHLDTRNIAFERNKSGIWGWRSEKMEVVSGYEAKVYSASNVELVTKTRTEHLSDQDKSRTKGSRTPFHSFLGLAQQHSTHNGAPAPPAASPTNPTAITLEEYFDPHFDLEARNIGRPIEVSSKVQRFKATLWLCEQHPLSLAEQVTPIIDLMAISNAHFAKLRDFITLKLPPGFPVKIEIPLFHVLNARITFSNLCGCDQPLGSVRVCNPTQPPGARAAGPGGWPFPCEVEPAVFEVPPGYTVMGAGRSEPLRDEDDDLLQFAIQQSLLDAGTETEQVTVWEALTNARPGPRPPPYDEELQLERCVRLRPRGAGLGVGRSGTEGRRGPGGRGHSAVPQGAAGEPAAAGRARTGRHRHRPRQPRLRWLRGAAAVGHGAVGARAGGARAAPAGGGRGAAAHPAPLAHRQVAAHAGVSPGRGAATGATGAGPHLHPQPRSPAPLLGQPPGAARRMYMDVYRALSTAECGLCLGRGGGQGLREGAVTGRKGSPGVRPSPKFCPVPLSRPAGGSPDVGRGGAVPAAPPGPFRARCGRGRRGASWTGHGVGHRAEGAGLLRGSPRGRRCAQARPPAAASFALVRGAALLLPAKEPPASGPAPAATPGRQERHLQLMMRLLRAQDAIQLAVRLEAARPQRVRYLLVVRPEEVGAEGQTALLGVDFTHEGADHCTLGMVLPLWSDTQVFLDGDGGFSVTSGGQTRIFKPISIQTMWAVLQELHRACELAAQGGHIPGGPALSWAQEYAAVLDSEQSCLNEWLAMADLESVRPGSPLPTEPTERVVRALLQDVLTSADLESITSKEVRTELERRVGHSLEQHKDFIDNEMLLVLAQMDRPSRVFPHIYLGSEWNAANLEELQQNCVTHILNVAREVDNFFPALFNYMNVRVYDEETAQLLPHWNDTFLFLSDIKAKGGRALVHCRMGLSRSAATVLAYAMKEFGWSLERALRHVRRCRPDVQPNPGFMRQLDFYQGILNASRHSSFWEPQAAERSPEPEEAVPWDEADLPPSPPASSPPPEEDGRPRLVGVSRRPRISLCAVMRSISQMEAPENLGEPPGGEVSKGDRGAGDGATVEAAPPGARPRSRPCRVVRQASVDGDRDPAEDNGP